MLNCFFHNPLTFLEIKIATYYNKPILSIIPHGYKGNVPKFIQIADTEGGPVGFNTPSIIKYIGTIKQRLSLVVVDDGLVLADGTPFGIKVES